MTVRPQHIVREIGTALAVLALYVLVLLAPLHQAAGFQRDLAQLGFENQLSWSVCASLSDAGDPDTPNLVKCPLAGAGKSEIAGPGGALSLFERQNAHPVAYEHQALRLSPHSQGRPGKPRGPPHIG